MASGHWNEPSHLHGTVLHTWYLEYLVLGLTSSSLDLLVPMAQWSRPEWAQLLFATNDMLFMVLLWSLGFCS